MSKALTPRQIAVGARIEKWKDHETVKAIKSLIESKCKEQHDEDEKRLKTLLEDVKKRLGDDIPDDLRIDLNNILYF